MLKLMILSFFFHIVPPAAFRRLCVETLQIDDIAVYIPTSRL